MKKPTLGIYGPAGKDRSGVTEYLDILTRELSRAFECQRVSNANYKSPRKFDFVLYNIGNNLFHRCAFRALAERSGVSIIHEFICLDYYFSNWDRLSNEETELILNGASKLAGKSFQALEDILEASKKYPASDFLSLDFGSEAIFLKQITLGIVHSRNVLSFLKKRYPNSRLTWVPFPVDAISKVEAIRSRAAYNLRPSEFVFGSFGYIGEYKRIEKIIEAWSKFVKQKRACTLFLVGEKQYNITIPNLPGLRYLGYISKRSIFDRLLVGLDCGIQLRYPCLGETSATLMKLLSHSRPFISSKIPFLKEFQNKQGVFLVKPDKFEIDGLIGALSQAYEAGKKAIKYDNIYQPNLVADTISDSIFKYQ